MSFIEFPKDIKQLLSGYISETPEDWTAFKDLIDKDGSLTAMKREEVLNRPVWIEIKLHNSFDYIKIYKIHFTKESMEVAQEDARSEIMRAVVLTGSYKTVFIQKQIKDLL